MTPLLTVLKWCGANLKLLVVIALTVAIFYTGDRNGSNRVQSRWYASVAEQTAAQLAKNQADNARLNQLETKANEESADNQRLRANNHALWLRLPKTPCGGSGQASTDTTAEGGELPTQSESYLAEAKRQLDDEAFRADEVVKECRKLNEFNQK